MADYEIDELARFEWMQSRIPAVDALIHFVPDGPRDAAVDSFGQVKGGQVKAGDRQYGLWGRRGCLRTDPRLFWELQNRVIGKAFWSIAYWSEYFITVITCPYD